MLSYRRYRPSNELTPEIKTEIEVEAIKNQVDPLLITAIIKTESDFNPLAQRYEPAYPYLYSVKELAEIVGCSRDTMVDCQKTSYGLMQLMGALCYERFAFRGWPAQLFNVKLNLNFGCRYVRSIIDRGYENPLDIYACYNAGSVRKVQGIYVNTTAVNNFRVNYEGLGGVVPKSE
jgi:soluble lytic murein transglycosylase-like protein